MALFGPLHLTLLAVTLVLGLSLVWLCRRVPGARRPVRLVLGYGLAANELGWWAFRYSHEGVHLWNLPLQLCDVTLWMTIVALITLMPALVEFAYFAGLAGAAMALLTPDLWSPWPTYPAISFFVAHDGIVVGIAVLVFGGIAPLRQGALWRAFGILLGYAGLLGAVNAVFATNFMYLCKRPSRPSLLDLLGPWPEYLAGAAVLALVLFGLLGWSARQLNSIGPDVGRIGEN